jgi:prophage regulatory protein
MREQGQTDGSAVRFIRYEQLKSDKGIPFSRVHVDRLEKAGSFPQRVRLGKNTVAWREDEIDAWSVARSAERGPYTAHTGAPPVRPNQSTARLGRRAT